MALWWVVREGYPVLAGHVLMEGKGEPSAFGPFAIKWAKMRGCMLHR